MTARSLRAVLAGAAAGLALARWWRPRPSAGRGVAAAPRDPAPGRELEEQDVPEAELVRRVRERAAVPDGVEVAIIEGAVVVFGRVARHALEPLLQRVARVEGVTAVENRLTPIDDRVIERPP